MQQDVQIGITKVLYRAAQHRDLELLRNIVVEKQTIVVQAGCSNLSALWPSVLTLSFE